MADKLYGAPQNSDGQQMSLHDIGSGTYCPYVFDLAAGSGGTTTVVGTSTVFQSAGTNLHVVVDGTSTENIVLWGGTAVPGGQGLITAGSPRIAQGAAGTLNFNQVSVGTASTSVIGTNTNRVKVTFINQGTTPVFLGTSTALTTSSSIRMAGIDGYPVVIRATVPIFGIVSSGTQVITYIEESM